MEYPDSFYKDKTLSQCFQQLKANVCDLNPALVIKAISGTEQEFIMLMERAETYINMNFLTLPEAEKKKLVEMFQDCIFGYYILTPLLNAPDVSDIKVYNAERVVVKANGVRYVTDIKFYDDADFASWYDRILRINGIGRGESGKSTLLNNMIDMIPFNQSGLVIQESDELYSNEHAEGNPEYWNFCCIISAPSAIRNGFATFPVLLLKRRRYFFSYSSQGIASAILIQRLFGFI